MAQKRIEEPSPYRTRNGWVDTGRPLISSKGKVCPNCGSPKYVETLSREHCSACGLECDYWGGGANPVYEKMMARDGAAEERKRREEQLAWERDESNWREDYHE